MLLWGIVTIGQGLVQNQAGLIAMRLLLGLFEAGFFPGCVYLISMYYKRYELQWRLNLFFCGAILAGAFSGLLAYALAKLDGLGGYEGWRWIFIMFVNLTPLPNHLLTHHSEGIITVGVAIVSKWLIPDWPETASFLTSDERRLLIARLSADVADAKMNRLDGPARKRVFGDWKIYCGVVMYIGIVNTGYATSFFTPTIIKDLGFTAEAAQIRSIPVFVVATVVSLIIAWCADRARHRFGFCILGICMASVGYIILLCQDSVSVGVRYFAIFIIVSGGYTCQPVTLAWIQNNMTGHYKRSIASAMMVGFGNGGGIVASNIFITKEAPHYTTGYATSLGLLWMCAAACVVLLLGVRAENKKRDRGERDWRLDTADADNLGDDHPHFRFTY